MADDAPSIVDRLPSLVGSLDPQDHERWAALYSVEVLTGGGCSVPAGFLDKVERWFGQPSDADPAASAVERVQRQRVLAIFNRRSCEEARFNSLRVARPQPSNDSAAAGEARERLEEMYAATGGEDRCDFCAWSERTAEDTWGRVLGKAGCVTASNVAKANGDHGLVILPGHHPLRELRREVLEDVMETAAAWARRCVTARGQEAGNAGAAGTAAAWFPTLLWNCGMGSGATQPHGHAQVILTAGRAPGRAEVVRRAAEEHWCLTGRDYWADTLWCHERAGLAVAVPSPGGGEEADAHVLAHMTPVASRELLVLGRTPTAVGRGLHFAAQVLLRKFGARSLNIACQLPPLQACRGDGAADLAADGAVAEEWISARVLDQTDKPTAAGNAYGATFATFEVYGPAVDDFDPYRTVQLLRKAVSELDASA